MEKIISYLFPNRKRSVVVLYIKEYISFTYRIMDIAERNSIARNVARLGEVLPGEISPVKVSMQPVKLTEPKPFTH